MITQISSLIYKVIKKLPQIVFHRYTDFFLIKKLYGNQWFSALGCTTLGNLTNANLSQRTEMESKAHLYFYNIIEI